MDSSELLARWTENDSYFDDLAVFSLGPLHPGGLEATKQLISSRDWRGTHVLDIGCGNGFTMRLIEAFGGTVFGVEPSPFMRYAAQKNGVLQAQLLGSSLETLVLDVRKFDVILFEGVIGFVHDPTRCIVVLTENLRLGGEIYVCDWMHHGRESDSQYGFEVKAQFGLAECISSLKPLGFKCALSVSEAVALAFEMTEAEALRRACLFFDRPPEREFSKVVRRKVARMKRALADALPTRRFQLRLTRAAALK